MKDISDNIKKVLIVFLICFVGLISYITYFQVMVAPQIVNSQYNARMWAKRNEVLRGSIFDRNMKILSKSIRVDTETQKRSYEGGEAFAHALGYVDVRYGITGLERRYDKELSTSSITETLSNILKLPGQTKEKYGSNLRTTLDYNVQKRAYELLGNNRGAVVALNPKTGEILALISKPSFNPNSLEENWKNINSNKDRPLLNRATAGMYPPGSTFKVITAISALENIDNVVNKRIQDKGVLVFNEKESLKNYNGEVLGNIGLKEAFIHSSNVYFGSLGIDLGNSKLKDTAERFYFNKDIPADGVVIENSKFPSFKSYEKGNIAQSAIGQSTVLSTPMEMALVASTIANDGTMMKPHIVKGVMDSKNSLVSEVKPQKIDDVTTKENAQIIKNYMREVVAQGTGGNASVYGIKVAGKTGTADHKEEGSGAKPHSWFIGFAPYENPEIALAVIVEDGGQGGVLAASIASGVIKEALSK